MKKTLFLTIASGLSLSLIAGETFAQEKLYKWVDENGAVQYSDHIPPEHANFDRNVLNEQGLLIGFEEGEITAEERAETERLEAIAISEQQARSDAARRDQMLLDTYLSVSDIEDLRDRRLELIDSQISVTEFYLSNLRRRQASLERESMRFAPLSDKEDAPPLPGFLRQDIARTMASIELYEQTLGQSRQDQKNLHEAFDLDIERFKELRGD